MRSKVGRHTYDTERALMVYEADSGDIHYCDVIIDRWERFTVNVAEMVIE